MALAAGEPSFALAQGGVPVSGGPAGSKDSGANAALDQLAGIPAYEIERVGDASASVRVGDTIELRVTGLNLPGVENATRDLVVEPLSASEDLEDAGWVIAPQDKGKDDADGKSGDEKSEDVPPTELRIRATVLKPGRLTLPPLKLSLKPGAQGAPGGEALAKTAPFEIEVASAIKQDDPNPKQPENVRPPAALKFPWVTVAVFSILVLSLIAGLVYRLKRWSESRRLNLSQTPAAPPKPEHEWAMDQLAELERQKLADRGQFKAHYFGVSEIVKAYVARRYHFAALECTTGEMLQKLADLRPGETHVVEDLRALFSKLDQVKFSDHVPAAPEPSDVLQLARRFVNETKLVAAPVLPEAGEPRL